MRSGREKGEAERREIGRDRKDEDAEGDAESERKN